MSLPLSYPACFDRVGWYDSGNSRSTLADTSWRQGIVAEGGGGGDGGGGDGGTTGTKSRSLTRRRSAP
jgi:hypothetical protein